MEFRVIAMPERKEDVPKPRITATRRVELPEGRYIEVIGGYAYAEQQFWAWWLKQLAGLGGIDGDEERVTAENDLNAYMATFLDNHIASHNLTYPGTDEPLPESGWELFWEVPATESLRIARAIVNPPSAFDSPKAGPNSTTG